MYKTCIIFPARPGGPVAYKFMTGAAPLLLAKPHSAIYKRGKFATKNLWVTPHCDEERWPAGNYMLMSKGGEGLAQWAEQVTFGGCHPGLVQICSFGAIAVVAGVG